MVALFQQNTAQMNLCMSYMASDQSVNPPESHCLGASVQFNLSTTKNKKLILLFLHSRKI